MREILDCKIQDLSLAEKVVTVRPQTSLKESLEQMKDLNIGSLIITDKDNFVEGIFTERDYLMKVSCREHKFFTKPIAELMTEKPVTINYSDSLKQALHKMTSGNFRHLVVLNQRKALKNVLSIKDIVSYLVANLKLAKDLGEKNIFDFKISDLSMGTNIVFCREHDTMKEALTRMQVNKSGGIIITEANREVIGIFTERDNLHKIAGREERYIGSAIKQFMTPFPYCMETVDSIYRVIRMMTKRNFRHIVVVNEQDRLLNIITMKDVMDYLIERF